MSNLTSTIQGAEPLLLGNNQFETGVITLAAGAQVEEGAYLKRDAGGKFVRITDTATEIVVAVSPMAASNATGAAVDVPCRPVIAGRVNQAVLKVNGAAPTKAQLDMLRKTSIIPLPRKDLSVLDNH